MTGWEIDLGGEIKRTKEVKLGEAIINVELNSILEII